MRTNTLLVAAGQLEERKAVELESHQIIVFLFRLTHKILKN